ncbi:MAG: Ger(x)C family spore germination protein [Candidatus Pristimantibacillus lignocellulolyticus]|uniref:Ger(X)C family spore germination protein n=1 Tax=Candidatus Pristimantibacillus lignocellulolyticus TaxID=2994561 RepID=A0A9J6ZKF7_9BACL|nr:MAG: Ger(x)C family spore germination protein [Candidatus Pristimantibacillus lignocellulolyticus]
MLKKLLLLAITFSMMIVLSGCWNRREINDMVIAVGMGVDKLEEGYLVSVQVVDPSEIAAKKGSGHTPVTLYVGKGKTIFDAVREMSSIAARKIYFSHLRMFLIGEETARTEGIGTTIEFLTRDHEFREDFYIAIARKTTAKEILKGLTPIEKIPANKMFTSLEMSSKSWAATSTVKIDELISDLMSEGKAPVITGISYMGDPSKADKKSNAEISEPYARLKYGGMAVFWKDKLIGWLNEEESRGYNYLVSKVKSSVGAVTCPREDGNFSVEINGASSHMQVRTKDNSKYLDINIIAVGSIGEVQCQIDLTDPSSIHELEKLAAEVIEANIKKTLNKSFEMQSDFVGLGAAIHRSDPKAWKTLKEDWNERMETYPINTSVTIKLIGTGRSKRSFLEKIKE